MKRLTAVVMMLLITIGAVLPAFGAIATNAEPWAVDSMEYAYNQGLITDENLLDAKREITRLEFSKIVVLLYEKNKGEKLVPKNKSPFTDCNAPAVIAAYEAGIISGTEPTKFQPNASLTREQLAILLNRILNLWSISLEAGTEKYAFTDISHLMEPSINVISRIKNAGILVGDDDGKFYPMRALTFQEAVMGLVKMCRFAEEKKEAQNAVKDKQDQEANTPTEVESIQVEPTKVQTPIVEQPTAPQEEKKDINEYETIYINDKTISLGATSSELKKQWGEPSRIDATVYGLKRYVYVGDYEKYFFVTLNDDKIIEIFVPTRHFTYLGTSGAGTSADIKQLNYISLVEHSGIIDTETTHASIPLDYKGMMSGILLQQREFAYGNYVKSGLTSAERENTEAALLDLIQVRRKEEGLPLLTVVPKLSNAALAHSRDMVEKSFLSYTGSDGSNPFTRIMAEQITFTSASEVIAKQRGDVTNVYQQWIRTPAQLEGLLDPSVDSVGIGVGQKGKELYVTVDFCGGTIVN